MKSLLAQIKKDIETKEKYNKKFLEQVIFANAKAKREAELIKMLKEYVKD